MSFFTISVFSQTQISGIINQYTKVTAVDPCEAKLVVADGSLFMADADVLLIQMKGATINSSNSGSFGNIDDLGGAGLYEMNKVLSVTGNTVFLKNELLHPYSPANSLQLVTIPIYTNVDIVADVKAKPWDGQSGGVLVLNANVVNLQAAIDVSGVGFRGAPKAIVSSDCNFLTNADGFHYNPSNWRGSPKGEGIAEFIQDKEHGRGAQANGGGGGNDHNSGGGGGANMTAGGNGGKQSVSGFGCDGDYPGRGGKPNPTQPGRIYMGGGGGAGHFDDTGAGSSGANGGGIVIVIAETIIGNGFSILANGAKPPTANGDGAGGGGAGGTILLKANMVTGALNIVAIGGGGGDANNTPTRCNGTGGGGSGGRLLTNITNLGQVNLAGGQPGLNTVPSGQCNGPSNEAEVGEMGVQANLVNLLVAQNEMVPVEIVQQPTDVLACVGVPVDVAFQVQGNYLSYQWQVNTGNGWQNVPTNTIYVGSLSPELSILNVVPAMNGFQYRCLVSSPCANDFYSNAVSLVLTSLPVATFTITSLGNGSYLFQNTSLHATDFSWDFGDGNTSTAANPTHSYADFGNYTVTLTATGPCGQNTLTIELTVAHAPTANFSFLNTGFCAPQMVQFTNLSTINATGFEWQLPGGTPSVSFEANPLVSYNQPGIFDVVLIANNSAGSDTFSLTQAIEIGGPPVPVFNLTVSGLTVSFLNQSLNANSGFLWDFGDGTTSNEANPVHTYNAQGLFQVTLTAFNQCGQVSTTTAVPTGSLPFAQFSADFGLGCTPMTVHFQNNSSGSSLNGFSWEFPGGVPAFSNLENPTVTYNQPGSFSVKLTVTSPLGSNTNQKLDFITVNSNPAAVFSFIVDEQTVYFTNESIGASFYLWDFGDGTTSQAVNPVHDYGNSGVFDVVLTAGNLNCGSALSQAVYLEPSATFEAGQPTQMVIYPNPASTFFTVYLPQKTHAATKLRVLDAMGRVCQVIDYQGDSVEVSMDGFAAGIYTVEVFTVSGSVFAKLVKL